MYSSTVISHLTSGAETDAIRVASNEPTEPIDGSETARPNAGSAREIVEPEVDGIETDETETDELDADRVGTDETDERDADRSLEPPAILLATLGVIIGPLFPWGTVYGLSVYGYESGGGLLVFMLGLVALGVIYWHGWTAETMLTVTLVGAIVAAVAFDALGDAAIGVYVTLGAGLALYVAGLLGYKSVRSSGTDSRVPASAASNNGSMSESVRGERN